MKKIPVKFRIIIAIILVLAISAAGFLVYQYFLTNQRIAWRENVF